MYSIFNKIVRQSSIQTCIRKTVLRTVSSLNENIINSGFPDIVIPETDISDFVFTQSSKWGYEIAAECGITGRKFSYNDMFQKSRNLNKGLRKILNLSKSDIVAVLLPNIPEYPIVIFGLLQANLTMSTINTVYTPEEIAHQLKDSSAKAIVTSTELWKKVNKAMQLTKQRVPVITIKAQQSESTPNGAIDFDELVNTSHSIADIPQPSHTDSAFLPYSSGTTGLPKPVELTHYNIVANICQIMHPENTVVEETTETHQYICPGILPMFHIYGLVVSTLYLLACGAKIVTLPMFKPETFLAVLKQHSPQLLFMVPPLIIFLSTYPGVTPDHLKSIKLVMSGAAPLKDSDEQKFMDRINRPAYVIQGYGLTETSPVIAQVRKADKDKYNCFGSIGKPLVNTDMKIVAVDDENGTPLGPHSQGELYVRGPQVMKGYRNRPEENAKVFHNEWFKTGDIGYYDDNKLIYITDRQKELIKVKGFQVAPAELEGVIRSFEDVADAAVIGVPHERQGEAPRAYVVPKIGKTIDVDKLDEYVASKVANYKRLAGGIEVIDGIPKTASGKILRRQLLLNYKEQQKS